MPGQKNAARNLQDGMYTVPDNHCKSLQLALRLIFGLEKIGSSSAVPLDTLYTCQKKNCSEEAPELTHGHAYSF